MKIDSKVLETYPGLITGYAVVQGIKVEKKIPGLEEMKRQIGEKLKAKYASVSLLEIPEIRAYREFYRAQGADPSKRRPPTEYLLRRSLEGRFPTINTLVDIALLATIEYWVIVGVYDFDKIKGEPIVTLASKIETFETIDGKRINPEIGEVILRDSEKIIAGYIAGDARATMVTPETKNALIICWNTPGISREQVEAALQSVTKNINRYCNGRVEVSGVLG
jgi:DNA/RNA-binding domain of Phe-tRNA-synthetase-like protein